ncbi:MAG: HAD family hydrolase [Gemmatimonadota bacterium]|nr:HAD family hydrolase [Gemmatimonadota bacterium]
MTRRPLAVFDIDGTLTDTMDVDFQCYVRAVHEVIQVDVPADVDALEELEEVTDSAILAAVFESAGRAAPGEELEGMIARRVAALLAEALDTTPERFRPIPGARGVFGELRAAGWDCAMATGAWRPSAVVKLRGGGIPHDDVPLATSSDRFARRDIIRYAVDATGRTDRATVVYVGDGVWDGRAARRLGYGFVGIGSDDKVGKLRDAGAVRVLPDYLDFDAFVESLTAAAD